MTVHLHKILVLFLSYGVVVQLCNNKDETLGVQTLNWCCIPQQVYTLQALV